MARPVRLSRVGIIETPKSSRLDDRTVAAALSEEYARRVLSVCITKAKSVREIELETQISQATLYRHVTQLSESGLLFAERSALTEDGKRYELYRSRIRSARIEVDSAGVRIAWEPMEGVEERLARIWMSLRGT